AQMRRQECWHTQCFKGLMHAFVQRSDMLNNFHHLHSDLSGHAMYSQPRRSGCTSHVKSPAIQRTLIVFLHGIGDNIMLTGLLKEYQLLHPEEAIDLVVLHEGCRAVWSGNPHINRVEVYP